MLAVACSHAASDKAGKTTPQADTVLTYNGKAIALDHSGDHAGAQELYRKALALSPDSLLTQNNLAMSMILNGQIDDAIALLETLNKRKDANATVRQNLALAYGLKGNPARARELNLQDVSPEQAEQNLQFYEKYARLKQEQASSNASPASLDDLLNNFTAKQSPMPNP